MNPAFSDRRLLSAELLRRGQRALREGCRAEARRSFREAVAANPLEGRAWMELARLSSPVARAFYLVEAFDLNPTNRSLLEELRHAYRDVLRLTTGAASAAPPAAAPPPASGVEEKAAGLPSPSLLQVTDQLISQLDIAGVWEELRRAGREVSSVCLALARQLIRRVQTEPPPRLFTLLGVGLWFVTALLSVGLLATLSATSGRRQPAPAAVAPGLLRKVLLTPTASATPLPTATATPYPTVITATPIPSATPTETPTDTPQPALNWAPELAANAWIFESGACEGPFSGPVGTETFIWPANNHYLSGYNFNWRYHPGIDIAAQFGDPIYASDTGVVVFAGWNNQGYGNLVMLDHGNGWQTLYAHLSQFNVDCGQAVYQGDVIGYAGSTGNSTGPHLHFEMLNDTDGRVNPWSYLP